MSPKLTYRLLLKGFLATVLVVAGFFAGMRFASSIAETVDLTGEWIGTTTEDYDAQAHYDYRLVFEQTGDQLQGILYLRRNHDREIYTETFITGTIEGHTAFYKAEEILVLENASIDELCLVQTTVSFEQVNGQDMLVGTWEAQANQQPACDTITGHVLLTRQ